MTRKAALLDIDGTLVDSNDAHALAWVETLAEFGYRVEFERVRLAVALRCGGWNDAALAGAKAIYDGPSDLLAKLDESPFASRSDR
jgi:beta-phosphoglucomutase-like phosphatase (HAD superfamily)